MVTGHGHSYLVIAAPKDRTYWFLFDILPETKYANKIPKYSQADEEALVKLRRDDPITENLNFGDLYDRKIISTLVPLEEYVFNRWHYKRIITIGDSAHKVSINTLAGKSFCITNLSNQQIDPASGQGGNGAIESAALLVNALVRQLKLSPQGLSGARVETALAEVHALRYERAKRLVDQAHTLQKMVCHQFPGAHFLLKHLIPCFGGQAFADVVVPICSEATRIEGIPVPQRPHCVPFEDELPAKPIKGDLVRRVPWLLASGSLGLLSCTALETYGFGSGTTIYSTFQQWGTGGYLARFAGLSSTACLVTNLIPTLSTWLIEGSRKRTVLNPLSW